MSSSRSPRPCATPTSRTPGSPRRSSKEVPPLPLPSALERPQRNQFVRRSQSRIHAEHLMPPCDTVAGVQPSTQCADLHVTRGHLHTPWTTTQRSAVSGRGRPAVVEDVVVGELSLRRGPDRPAPRL